MRISVDGNGHFDYVIKYENYDNTYENRYDSDNELTFDSDHYEYLFVYEVMSYLLDQINGAKGELRRLLDGKGELTQKADLLVASLRDELASLRSLQLVEAQRGEMLVCFTTVMLDEFNIDVEINLSHVCHLRLNSFIC